MSSFGIFLSIVTLLSWGISDYLSSKGGKHLTPKVANFVIQTVSYPLSFGLVLVLGFPTQAQFSDLIIFAGIGAIMTIAWVSMLKGFTVGAVGVVTPLANSYAVVTLILSTIFLGLKLSSGHYFAFMVILAGVIVISYEKMEHIKQVKLSKAVYFGLLAMFAWGIGFTIVDSFSKFQWYQIEFLLHTSMVIIAVVGLVWSERLESFKLVKEALKHKESVAAGYLSSFGSIAFFSSAQLLGNIAIPAVIAAGVPLVTSYLAYLFDKERIQLSQRIGALLIVGGIVLLNIVH